MSGYAPEQGHVIHMDFSPQTGRETAGERYALVISSQRFNVASGLCVVMPITTKTGKFGGFEVRIDAPGAADPSRVLVQGVAIASFVRTIDYIARNAQHRATAPAAAVDKALRLHQLVIAPAV